MRRDDFIVVEGGERRPIIGFNAEADGPVRVAVLFDISGSMRVGTKAVDAKQTARHIFSSLKAATKRRSFAFDTQLDRVTGFTKDFKGLESKVDHVEQPFGQTSLFDAIAETAKAIGNEEVAGRKQRSAIVVLTDGIDTKSRLTAPDVSAIASSIDVPVYVVAVMSAVDDPRNPDYGTGSMSSGLTDLARWTGGDIFIAIAPAHASIAARQIVARDAASIHARVRGLDAKRMAAVGSAARRIATWSCARAADTRPAGRCPRPPERNAAGERRPGCGRAEQG